MKASLKPLPARLADILGAANVVNDPAELAGYQVDGRGPSVAARPASSEEVAELVKFAASERLAIIPMGARTKLGIGMPPARYDLAIDMTRLDRVISHDPGDLTLSVEAGIPLVRLSEALAKHHQFLPLAVPFYDRATVGGTLASGVDSYLRQAYGTARDFVLGMEFVTGEGGLAKSGGRVVKNVTGYDLHKLMLGAVGSLGIVTRVNFRTFPAPVQTATFLAGFRWPSAADKFNRAIQNSSLRPRAVEILCPFAAQILNAPPGKAEGTTPSDSDWLVAVQISGNDAVLNRCDTELQMFARTDRDALHFLEKIEEPQAESLWSAIREFPSLGRQYSADVAILKSGCLPVDFVSRCVAVQEMSRQHPVLIAHLFRGAGIWYMGIFPEGEPSEEMAEFRGVCASIAEKSAQEWHISPTVPWCSPKMKSALQVWGPQREDLPLLRRVKQAFDPHGIFAPGRFAGGL